MLGICHRLSTGGIQQVWQVGKEMRKLMSEILSFLMTSRTWNLSPPVNGGNSASLASREGDAQTHERFFYLS
jgi:hypothetical protein